MELIGVDGNETQVIVVYLTHSGKNICDIKYEAVRRFRASFGTN